MRIVNYALETSPIASSLPSGAAPASTTTEFSYQQQQAYKRCTQYVNTCKKGILPVINIELLKRTILYLSCLFLYFYFICHLYLSCTHAYHRVSGTLQGWIQCNNICATIGLAAQPMGIEIGITIIIWGRNGYRLDWSMDFLSRKLLCFGWCYGQEYKGLLCINVINKKCCNLVAQLIIYHEHAAIDKYEIRYLNTF